MTAKRLKRPRDPVQLGKLRGDILTGQVEDRAPDRAEDPTKDQAAPGRVYRCRKASRRRQSRPQACEQSFSERQNLSMRMGNRRMTRLTNAFSKKAENHAHMMAIYFMHYNFVRIHQTLKVTPAMAAGVTPKLWEMSDMIAVLEAWEATQ